MPGFTYQTSATTNDPMWRGFLALLATHNCYCGTVTLNVGETSKVISGLGFQPECVLIMSANISGPSFFDSAYFSLGAATPTDTWVGIIAAPDLGSVKGGDWRDDLVLIAGASATIDSFDADGFTLDISSPVPGPGNLAIQYLAMAGGNYAVGTDVSPATDGTQSISGLGFQPAAVLFASAQTEFLAFEGDFARICIGAGDDTRQCNAWGGSDAGDIYTNQATQTGAVLSLWADANSSGPFQPDLLSEAVLDSLDADGFTLDWTVLDAVQRQYSWLAVDEAYVDRWLYQHAFDNQLATISTPEDPSGLIFFMNSQDLDGSQNQANSSGANMALGLWGENLQQFLIAYSETDQPSFSVPRSDRELVSGVCIGSYGNSHGGLVTTIPNNSSNRGAIVVAVEDFMPQIYRRVFSDP